MELRYKTGIYVTKFRNTLQPLQ